VKTEYVDMHTIGKTSQDEKSYLRGYEETDQSTGNTISTITQTNPEGETLTSGLNTAYTDTNGDGVADGFNINAAQTTLRSATGEVLENVEQQRPQQEQPADTTPSS
jgi:hypothetical protein